MAESPTDLPRGYQTTSKDDPSALTVAMLDKAVGQIREFYDSQLNELKMGIKQAHDDYVRVPTLLDRAVADLKVFYDAKIAGNRELMDEKIAAAAAVRQEQFRAIDVRLQGQAERARDLDKAKESALDHALAAAKELVAASNNNFATQINELKTSFGSQHNSLDEKVNDLRDRLIQMSSSIAAGRDAAASRRADSGSYSSIVMAAIAIIGLLITIGTVVITRPAVQAPVYYQQAPPPAPR